MSFKLSQFDAEKLAATQVAWASTAEDLGIPMLQYEKVLTWVTGHVDYEAKNGDSYAYGIFEDENADAVAVVDIVHSTRVQNVGLIKMLEVTLGPRFAPVVEMLPDVYENLLNIYTQAIVGTVQLTSAHPARIIKMYGRDDDLMKLFLSLNRYLNVQADAPYASKIEGRWLVITAK